MSPITRRPFSLLPCRAFVPITRPFPSTHCSDRCRPHRALPKLACVKPRPDPDKDEPSMASVDQIQARLRVEIARMVEARTRSTRTGPGQNADAMPTFADAIEARLMQPAAPAEAAETPSTPTQ